MKAFVIMFALLSALMPVITQKTGLSVRYGFRIKMLCAFMYTATGLIAALAVGKAAPYSLLILGALVLGVLGDFFLEYKAKKLFPVGALFFALGHIVYSLTFLFEGEINASSYIAAVVAVTAAVTLLIIAFAKAKLKLTGKKKLILAYVPVLVFAFVCALFKGIAAIKAGNFSLGACLIFGGTLFLVSDAMIGIGKGGLQRPAFLHNAVTYTYFAAQSLFALSIYFQ